MPIAHRGSKPALVSRLLLVLSLSFVAGALGASAALAQEVRPATSDYARPGLYLSLAGGGLIKTFPSTGDPVADAALDLLSQGAYIGAKLGSRYNRWVATETSVDYGVKGFGAEGAGSIDNNPLYVSGNLKIFATQGRIQPYVAGGIGGAWLFTEVKGAGGGLDGKFTTGSFLGRVGGGVDIYLSRNIALGPEVWWNITTGDLESLRSVAVGGNLMFKF